MPGNPDEKQVLRTRPPLRSVASPSLGTEAPARPLPPRALCPTRSNDTDLDVVPVGSSPRSLSRSQTPGLLLGLVVATLGCHTGTPQSRASGNVQDQEPWVSLEGLDLTGPADISVALARPFDSTFPVAALGSDGGVLQGEVANCSQYFAMVARGFHAVSDQDFFILKTTGARCHALRMLVARGASLKDPPLDLDFRKSGLESLPPTLGPAPSPKEDADRDAAAAAGMSWRTFEPSAALEAPSAHRAKVTGPAWSERLEVWAIGDLRKVGATEALVFSSVTGTEGSWFEIKLRLLDLRQHQGVNPIVDEIGL